MFKSLSDHSSDSMTYSDARLTLGICYVGSIVVFACFMILRSLDSPARFVATESWSQTLYYLAFSIALFELASLPFDLAGWKIDRIYDRSELPFCQYFGKWLRASVCHGALLLCTSLLTLVTLRLGGVPLLFPVIAIFASMLLWRQADLARAVSGINIYPVSALELSGQVKPVSLDPPVLTARASCPGFTGGITGLPGRESIILPESWLETFGLDALGAEVARRSSVIENGARTRGFLLAVVFTAAGVSVSAAIAQSILPAIDNFAGLLSISLCFTLWSFLGLLILPRFNHLSVFAADSSALARGISESSLIRSIELVESCLEADQYRATSRDVKFHPVPALNRRIENLRKIANAEPICDSPTSGSKGDRSTGAWNCARYAVFLSIAGMGLLSRAVHCNAGRPELWVLLPSD
ncbi:hypothetical protein GC174_03885 [bacterium]|nr:hypothetical protein [bacterium]